ncbi:FAD/NAD(P)-binding protein [Paracoccaceae bacterium]
MTGSAPIERSAAEDGLRRSGPHVVIIGGGASGVLLAAHLLSQPERDMRVTIVEGRNVLGCGVAYSTTDPDHLLNTRVHNMSAFSDRPHHFQDWLAAQAGAGDVTGQSFVSRATYGAYMAELLLPWSQGEDSRRLRCLRQTCLRVEETPCGILAHLEDGQAVIGDLAVLATGHVQPEPQAAGTLSGPWQPLGALDPEARIVIVGSGLSMVDQVLSILKSGHRGEILSLSRRGQLPRAHTATTPLSLSPGDIPLGAPMGRLLAWARGLAARAEQKGGTWRDAVDGIRPHVRSIWRALPAAERARFLRHAATWWDVHRHRMPPASEAEIRRALASGQLVLQRAAFLGAEAGGPQGRRLTLRPKGADAPVTLDAARVIDCRGIRRDPETHASPLMADLLARGHARIDPLRIGLDITGDCRVIDRAGSPSQRLYAIGPASRAAFWEITAIPDIREQAARLATGLARH